jgi:hypothetical protein
MISSVLVVIFPSPSWGDRPVIFTVEPILFLSQCEPRGLHSLASLVGRRVLRGFRQLHAAARCACVAAKAASWPAHASPRRSRCRQVLLAQCRHSRSNTTAIFFKGVRIWPASSGPASGHPSRGRHGARPVTLRKEDPAPVSLIAEDTSLLQSFRFFRPNEPLKSLGSPCIAINDIAGPRAHTDLNPPLRPGGPFFFCCQAQGFTGSPSPAAGCELRPNRSAGKIEQPTAARTVFEDPRGCYS